MNSPNLLTGFDTGVKPCTDRQPRVISPGHNLSCVVVVDQTDPLALAAGAASPEQKPYSFSAEGSRQCHPRCPLLLYRGNLAQAGSAVPLFPVRRK